MDRARTVLVSAGVTVALALSSSGCFLDRSPLGGAGGPLDGGRPGPSTDAGPRPDGGPGPEGDAGPPDAGPPPCVERCEEERALTCRTGTVDCVPMGAYCAVEGGLAVCVPRVCDPGTTGCSMDGASVILCDARGTAILSSTPCSRGCAAGACRPETPCALTVERVVSEGTHTVDLCGGGNDSEHTDFDDCLAPTVDSGEDRVVRLEVSRAGRYRLELRDTSDASLVDPVLYVRSRCDDEESVIACHNNVLGTLNASLELDLAAGDHFLMLDSYDYRLTGSLGTGCGRVELVVTRL
jgi:hypothetical protein